MGDKVEMGSQTLSGVLESIGRCGVLSDFEKAALRQAAGMIRASVVPTIEHDKDALDRVSESGADPSGDIPSGVERNHGIDSIQGNPSELKLAGDYGHTDLYDLTHEELLDEFALQSAVRSCSDADERAAVAKEILLERLRGDSVESPVLEGASERAERAIDSKLDELLERFGEACYLHAAQDKITDVMDLPEAEALGEYIAAIRVPVVKTPQLVRLTDVEQALNVELLRWDDETPLQSFIANVLNRLDSIGVTGKHEIPNEQ